jgi:hypothetical protein
MGGFDFVHTWDFHQLSADNGEGSPAIFVWFDEIGRALACWPVLQRSIGGTDHFDLTCVYGYGGPLFLKNINVEKAMNVLWQAMREEGFVSLFSRMHPVYIEQIPSDDLCGKKLGDVVIIDVKSAAVDLQNYRASHRREILGAVKHGVKVHVDFDFLTVKDFCEIYSKTMMDLGANEYYLFDLDYFKKLKNSIDFKAIIIYAELEGLIIASSVFLVTNKVMQYYLSGTLKDFKRLAPSKIIIHRAHELAYSMGIEKVVLGGGVGSANDNLFKFKSGFSDLTLPFYVTRKILKEDVYNELCQIKNVDAEQTSFFPAYRG